jgi:hypothetical protein
VCVCLNKSNRILAHSCFRLGFWCTPPVNTSKQAFFPVHEFITICISQTHSIYTSAKQPRLGGIYSAKVTQDMHQATTAINSLLAQASLHATGGHASSGILSLVWGIPTPPLNQPTKPHWLCFRFYSNGILPLRAEKLSIAWSEFNAPKVLKVPTRIKYNAGWCSLHLLSILLVLRDHFHRCLWLFLLKSSVGHKWQMGL